MGKYSKSAAYAQMKLKDGIEFTIDACIIIDLAKGGYVDLLDKLKFGRNFTPTPGNHNEITGLIYGRRFDANTSRILKSFLRAVEGRIIKVDIRKYKKELEALVPLLPRKVVHDVMYNLPDSFSKELIKFFENIIALVKSKKMDISRAVANGQVQKNKEIDGVYNKIDLRIETLAKSLDIDLSKIDLRRYNNSIERFKNDCLKKIDEASRRVKNLGDMIRELKRLTSKEYSGDVEFVATTLARGLAGSSRDSDVITLFELHAARRVA